MVMSQENDSVSMLNLYLELPTNGTPPLCNLSPREGVAVPGRGDAARDGCHGCHVTWERAPATSRTGRTQQDGQTDPA